MKIQVIIQGDLIDMEDDKEIFLDTEMEDTVEDIIIKATFAVSGLKADQVCIYYNTKKWDKNIPFVKLSYKSSEFIYIKGSKDSCSCKIF